MTGAALAISLLAPRDLLAEENRSSQFAIGVAAFSQARAYGDHRTSLVPIIGYDSRYLRVSGTTVDLRIPALSSRRVSVSLRSNYDIGAGYEPSDTHVLRGMEERKPSVWIGPAVEWRTPIGHISAEWTKDASGHAQGETARLALSHPFKKGRLHLTPRAAAAWMSADTANYYHGVRPGEATQDRRTYQASSTTNFELGLRAAWAINDSSFIAMDVSGTRLGSAIRNSPLTENENTTTIGVGYARRF
ncbi:MipA/OmpV family protein [Aerolutibacter daejeonensis]|uniref:MipA/OmpV family protein n=1 Tax=Aerolutibacter daejeonensis TaxID=346181 RepID=UPI00068FC664|nr:MipA/OmpV family protein [Lysobacter daejeonensis]